MQPGGSEIVLLDFEVNLAGHFGENFQIADVDLPELDKKTDETKGIILKNLKYKCSIIPLREKDKNLYLQCTNYREKLEFVRQEDNRKKKEFLSPANKSMSTNK